jgi:hypothetical protein
MPRPPWEMGLHETDTVQRWPSDEGEGFATHYVRTTAAIFYVDFGEAGRVYPDRENERIRDCHKRDTANLNQGFHCG